MAQVSCSNAQLKFTDKCWRYLRVLDIIASTPSQLGAAILAAWQRSGLVANAISRPPQNAQPNRPIREWPQSMPSTNTLQWIAKATGHKLVIAFSRTASALKALNLVISIKGRHLGKLNHL